MSLGRHSPVWSARTAFEKSMWRLVDLATWAIQVVGPAAAMTSDNLSAIPVKSSSNSLKCSPGKSM